MDPDDARTRCACDVEKVGARIDAYMRELRLADEHLGFMREQGATVIKRARAELGLTLKQVADRAGVSITYVSDMERGRRDPAARVLEALSCFANEVPR